MQIAEETDSAAIRTNGRQHAHGFGLGDSLGLHGLSVLVHRLEPTAVEHNVLGVFAAEHRVGLRSRGDQNRFRGQAHRVTRIRHLAGGRIKRSTNQVQRRSVSVPVHFDFLWRQAFGEADAFLESFPDLFMVQRVAGRVDQPATVGDCHSAPRIQKFNEIWRATLTRSSLTLSANRAAMRDELVRGFGLLLGPGGANLGFSLFSHERFVALEKLLHLHDVVGERFSSCIDGCEPAANHDDRHPDLEIGYGVGLGRAGQLQRHQKIGRLPHASRQTVLHGDYGGAAGSGA